MFNLHININIFVNNLINDKQIMGSKIALDGYKEEDYLVNMPNNDKKLLQ
jgi:hypothetical protein